MNYPVGSITSRCSCNKPAEIKSNYRVYHMKTLIFRVVARIVKGEGSHCITPMVLTRWVCRHPRRVLLKVIRSS